MNKEYLEQINDFIHLDEGSTVLEIAGGVGPLVDIINKSRIKKYIFVEPNETWLTNCRNERHYNCETEWHCKVYEDYEPTEKIDTLICCGLVYHLLSPCHFFEKVANVYKPETFYLEMSGHWTKDYPDVYNPESIPTVFMPEKINVGGMRYSSDKRVIPYHILLNKDFVVHAMDTIGYKLEKFNNIVSDHRSKDRVVIFKFNRYDPTISST